MRRLAADRHDEQHDGGGDDGKRREQQRERDEVLHVLVLLRAGIKHQAGPQPVPPACGSSRKRRCTGVPRGAMMSTAWWACARSALGCAMPDKPTSEQIRDEITDTYFNLRVGMAALSFLFPIVFYAYTRRIYGELQQDSISAFYGYDGFIRDWFVG